MNSELTKGKQKDKNRRLKLASFCHEWNIDVDERGRNYLFNSTTPGAAAAVPAQVFIQSGPEPKLEIFEVNGIVLQFTYFLVPKTDCTVDAYTKVLFGTAELKGANKSSWYEVSGGWVTVRRGSAKFVKYHPRPQNIVQKMGTVIEECNDETGAAWTWMTEDLKLERRAHVWLKTTFKKSYSPAYFHDLEFYTTIQQVAAKVNGGREQLREVNLSPTPMPPRLQEIAYSKVGSGSKRKRKHEESAAAPSGENEEYEDEGTFWEVETVDTSSSKPSGKSAGRYGGRVRPTLKNVDYDSDSDSSKCDMKKYLFSPKYSDVTIISGTKKFHAHRVFIAGKSSVLQTMCDDHQNVTRKLTIVVDSEPEVVAEFLRFIYTGVVRDLAKNAKGLFLIAEKYNVTKLKRQSETSLLKNLCVENVLELYQFGKAFDSQPIVDKCIDLIKRNKAKLFKNETELAEAVKKYPQLFFKLFVP